MPESREANGFGPRVLISIIQIYMIAKTRQ